MSGASLAVVQAGDALHVETSGEGPPLVLLHGWAMHSGMWGSLVPRLAARFRVHAVDLPGHGNSRSSTRFTLDGAVDAVSNAVAGDTRPLTVIGWSLGGLLAMHWARREPVRVARLALVATTPRFVAGTDWPHAMATATLERFGDELRVAWKLTLQRFLALQLHGTTEGRSTLAVLRRRLFERGAPSPQVLAGALDLIMAADLRADAPRILQPAIVISGERDTLAFPAAGLWLAQRLHDARFVSIAGAGHVPFLSHPEAFGTALDGFLDGHAHSA